MNYCARKQQKFSCKFNFSRHESGVDALIANATLSEDEKQRRRASSPRSAFLPA